MDAKILEIARTVRLAAEQVRTIPTDLEGACASASYVLWKHLRKQGYDADFIMGSYHGFNHCWVEIEDRILDITATQFGVRKKVYTRVLSAAIYQEELRGKDAAWETRRWNAAWRRSIKSRLAQRLNLAQRLSRA